MTGERPGPQKGAGLVPEQAYTRRLTSVADVVLSAVPPECGRAGEAGGPRRGAPASDPVGDSPTTGPGGSRSGAVARRSDRADLYRALGPRAPGRDPSRAGRTPAAARIATGRYRSACTDARPVLSLFRLREPALSRDLSHLSHHVGRVSPRLGPMEADTF